MDQQTRTGRIKKERRFDKTQLRASHYGYVVHRDFASHFFRWGWVSRHIKHGSTILDVGCGQDVALARVLSGRIGGNREQYVGIDLNRINKPFNAKWCTVLDEFNFIKDYMELKKYAPKGFDYIVNLEMIEHMNIIDGKKLLKNIYNLLSDDGLLYLSTPVFNGKKAANHIYEYRITELKKLLDSCGFFVKRRYGTFISKFDLKKVCKPKHWEVYEQLEEYYGGDVMSTFLAPLYANQARNNLWVLRKDCK